MLREDIPLDPGVADGTLEETKADADGAFLLHTVRPAQYTIPDQGPTGLLPRRLVGTPGGLPTFT